MKTLTHARVHTLRTANLPDRHFERLWQIHARIIRRARIGLTWKDHPTPPDTKPRTKKGNWGDLTDTSISEHP
jgi:hypothetical protein